MDAEGEQWKERAKRLARLIDGYLDQPGEGSCWHCGAWSSDGEADHAESCRSAEVVALIEEINATGRDRFDPAG